MGVTSCVGVACCVGVVAWMGVACWVGVVDDGGREGSDMDTSVRPSIRALDSMLAETDKPSRDSAATEAHGMKLMYMSCKFL